MTTTITLSCSTCGGTCCLEQGTPAHIGGDPRLRLSAHADIRDAWAIPQPSCPASERELRLCRADVLDRLQQGLDREQPEAGHLRELFSEL